MQKAIHTTVAFGLIVSFIMTLVGIFFTPTLLQWMGTPESVMDASVTYFKIYFLGSFGSIMYNFFVGILQAVGDSKHSLYYLIISSVVNIHNHSLILHYHHVLYDHESHKYSLFHLNSTRMSFP